MQGLVVQILFGLLLITGVLALLIHFGFRAPRVVTHKNPKDFGVAYQTHWIRTSKGKKLFAWFLPAADNAPVLIIVHGWGGNAGFMLPLALPFHRAGMHVVLVEARNHGRSDRDTFSSLPRFAEDASHAIDWVKRQVTNSNGKIILLGHSVGAGAVLLEASRRDDIAAVISVSAFAHPAWMMQRYLQRPWIPRLARKAILRYVEWIIGHRFDEIAPMHTACRITCPVLLVHGRDDQVVPVSDLQAIVDNCPDKTHIQVLLVSDAGHNSISETDKHMNKLVTFLNHAEVFETSPKDKPPT
ncbi:MAG TPA: alpha/beta fold hydrolase [Chromatiales bacterium]|nr:alpha/beta fold hydrolase [Thiotrichales bacterium]HIP69033.1 alpha/beta fold hydrolase [Chromatiales bacterium]